jgi:Domain of unknown function (DUF4936)
VSGRGLFIWFRVGREHEVAAIAALRELQAQWSGLQCELLRRADEPGGQVTLMEVYRHACGVTADWQQRIEREAQARLAPWLIGERHTEVFEPCA